MRCGAAALVMDDRFSIRPGEAVGRFVRRGRGASVDSDAGGRGPWIVGEFLEAIDLLPQRVRLRRAGVLLDHLPGQFHGFYVSTVARVIHDLRLEPLANLDLGVGLERGDLHADGLGLLATGESLDEGVRRGERLLPSAARDKPLHLGVHPPPLLLLEDPVLPRDPKQQPAGLHRVRVSLLKLFGELPGAIPRGDADQILDRAGAGSDVLGFVLLPGLFHLFPEFEHALSTMKIGEIIGPMETEWGFHVIRRDKIDRVGASHILISYKGSQRAELSLDRSKEEALKLAEQVSAEAKAPGANFAELAKKYSDGPNGVNGGVIGLIERGQVPILFERAVFALEIDGIAGPLETPFGYHVILRTE